MRYVAEHKAQTRARVLAQAVAAVREGGPQALGVAEVMKRAGLTHGGFYAHFTSREALLDAAVEEMFASAGSMLQRAGGEADAREALRSAIRLYVSRSHRDAREGGCPLPILSGDLPRMGEAARARFAEGVARLTDLLAGKLAAIGHPGDPGAAAASLLAEMVGALVLARAMGATAQSDALLANTRAALLKRLALGDAP